MSSMWMLNLEIEWSTSREAMRHIQKQQHAKKISVINSSNVEFRDSIAYIVIWFAVDE